MSGLRSNVERILELYAQAMKAEGPELEQVMEKLREVVKEETARREQEIVQANQLAGTLNAST